MTIFSRFFEPVILQTKFLQTGNGFVGGTGIVPIQKFALLVVGAVF